MWSNVPHFVTLLTSKDNPDVLDEFPFIDLDELSTLCQKLYFPIKGLSIPEFITVQSCVFFMTRDLVQQLVAQFNFDPLEIQQILSQCSTTLAQVTHDLTLLIQPSFENIRALLLLVSGLSAWVMTLLIIHLDIRSSGDRSICNGIEHYFNSF